MKKEYIRIGNKVTKMKLNIKLRDDTETIQKAINSASKPRRSPKTVSYTAVLTTLLLPKNVVLKNNPLADSINS